MKYYFVFSFILNCTNCNNCFNCINCINRINCINHVDHCQNVNCIDHIHLLIVDGVIFVSVFPLLVCQNSRDCCES